MSLGRAHESACRRRWFVTNYDFRPLGLSLTVCASRCSKSASHRRIAFGWQGALVAFFSSQVFQRQGVGACNEKECCCVGWLVQPANKWLV